ncbi:hypothetical protein [Cohnella soli]|uniref:Uncharacterized protein n=1 Tax=Cohnella soli TaxID=425005 RepID=A0ABW0HNL8_9BACL
MSRISGKYTFENFVHLESNRFYEQPNDLLHIVLHELKHREVAQSTSFGAVNYLIQETAVHCLASGNFESYAFLAGLSSHYVASSELTYECLSYYSQYAMIKFMNPADFDVKFAELQTNYAYGSFKLHRVLHYLNSDNWQEMLSSGLIARIGSLAMNLAFGRLLELRILNESELVRQLVSDKIDYNPDYRFHLLLNSLEALLTEYDVGSITDDLLLQRAKLDSSPLDPPSCIKLVEHMKKEFTLLSLPVKILDKNIRDLGAGSVNNDPNKNELEQFMEQLDLVRPAPINQRYEVIDDIQLEDFDLKRGIISSMWVLILGGQNKYYCLIFDDIGFGKRFLFHADRDKFEATVCKFGDLPICMYSDDYEEMLLDFPLLSSREIFVCHNAPYLQSKELIEKHISPGREMMFHQLNNEITVVFILLKNNDKLMMMHAPYSISFIIEDIRGGKYNYINCDSQIDGVFWTGSRDWWKYEDIMMSLSETSKFDFSTGTPGLGHRMTFTDLI